MNKKGRKIWSKKSKNKFRIWEKDAKAHLRYWTWDEVTDMDLNRFFNNPGKYKMIPSINIYDINGEEIFSGDIVEFDDIIIEEDKNNKCKNIISIKNQAIIVCMPLEVTLVSFKYNKNNLVYRNLHDKKYLKKVLESSKVIRNVYQNKELLKKEKESI